MSKLDRQTDQASSIAPMVISWHAFDDVDVAAIKEQLHKAILAAEYRVPLDCRGVEGVPTELVDMLLDENDFAQQFGKRITLAFASDELRNALRPGVHHRTSGKVNYPVARQVDAATAAAESLNERLATVKPRPELNSAAVNITSLSAKKALKRKGMPRVLKLGAAVALGAACIGGIEWYLVFNETESLNISHFVEEGMAPPVKTFEEDGGPPVTAVGVAD